MLDGGFRSLFDELPAVMLAELDGAGLEHEDVKTCIRFGNVRANIALDVCQSVVERLAPSYEVAKAVLDYIVRQIVGVGVALTKDACTKQRTKKDSIDATSQEMGVSAGCVCTADS